MLKRWLQSESGMDDYEQIYDGGEELTNYFLYYNNNDIDEQLSENFLINYLNSIQPEEMTRDEYNLYTFIEKYDN